MEPWRGEALVDELGRRDGGLPRLKVCATLHQHRRSEFALPQGRGAARVGATGGAARPLVPQPPHVAAPSMVVLSAPAVVVGHAPCQRLGSLSTGQRRQGFPGAALRPGDEPDLKMAMRRAPLRHRARRLRRHALHRGGPQLAARLRLCPACSHFVVSCSPAADTDGTPGDDDPPPHPTCAQKTSETWVWKRRLDLRAVSQPAPWW
jgi:hypothetical protein